MGNSRSGGTQPPPRPREGDSSSTRASGGPAIPAARGGANEAASRPPSRGEPGEPGRRSSGRGMGSTGPGNAMRPCSVRQQNAAAEEARLGTPNMAMSRASNSPSRDSDRSAGSKNGAEERMGENAASSSKKRKGTMHSRSYVKRFKTLGGAKAAVGASPDRVGKENTSTSHVADSNISKLCEGSRLVEKNKRHSSDAACKVLHETLETRVNQHSAPFSEVMSECTSRKKKHPDDRSQTGCQPDRATGLSNGGAATSHHLGDVRMHVQEKDGGNLAANPAPPVSPTYPADSPVTLQVSTEVESQICEPSVAVKQSTSPPTQQSLAVSRHPPAEAEPSSILGTEAAGDLQPEVEPSTSIQDEPEQAEDEPETEDEPEVEDELVGMMTALQPSSSVPAEQNTGLPAQQSLATSQHPPAEDQQADVLGTEPACGLQPEVQPSTSDEPAEAEDEEEDEPEVPDVEDESEAEAERAGTLGAIAAPDLQPEMQSSTTQDVPFERTVMSGMPVLQCPIIHRSVESYAGVESAGMVTAHDLHSEILPSASVPAEESASLPSQQSLATSGHSPAEAEPADILGTEATSDLQPSQGEVQAATTMQVSMQDRPAETEGAVTLGSTAAQDLQPELQSSTPVQHVPLGLEPNMLPGPEQPSQHPPVTMLAFNIPVLSDEPLKHELDRLMHCNIALSKGHEHKKSQLVIEYNQELEKINKKYDSLLQNEGSAYLHAQLKIADLYRKVYVNKSVAEHFAEVLTPSSAAQGRSTSPVTELLLGSRSAARIAASAVMSSSAMRPPGSHVRPSFVAQPSSAPWNSQPQSILHGNPYGTTSPPCVPHGSYRGSAGAQSRAVQPPSASASNLYRAPPPHGYRYAGAQLRAYSAHLQQPRTPAQYAVHTDQQQLHAPTPGVTSWGQYAHQAMLASASAAVVVSNPIFIPAHQQSSYPNMVLGGTPGPQNGIHQHGGAQMAGVNPNQSGSESAYMPPRFGLGSSSSLTGTVASIAQVVCLSDAE